ncbi:glycogen synthase [Kosmotoga arenicorallina S304]|uniref:Glycogen synthase n=1 Tax=Kosmotoga arenicorallina S304 TaxID=1453497 RepID=A0A176K1D0_9BACT|nr:glycogen/starch synthase [Kosmotoga arenicorallina]OAA30885.1 glycogen synthase [Kosmotoga arenicorallina S304]
MKILMVSYEVYPLAKVGGLADVVGSLPEYLVKQGVEVQIAMPYHQIVEKNANHIEKTGLTVNTSELKSNYTFEVYKTTLNKGNIPVFLLKNDELIDSDDVYGGSDLGVQALAFSDAVFQLSKILKPDIVHCNDWQTGLIPAFIKTFFGDAIPKTLITIHNLGYQGTFDKYYFELTKLPGYYWERGYLSTGDMLNFLKAGIVFSDFVSTVSPTYAEEIKTEEYGMGLNDLLSKLGDRLVGIINGIDYTEYNPETDKRIAATFSIDDLSGKKSCKLALQKELGLPETDAPVVGLISRLVDQKGLDILAEAAEDLLAKDLQLVILGTGEERYENLFRSLEEKFPQKVSANICFDVNLAQKIYAGSDMFLMPSKYEPCGLGQMFAMRYGTVPVVRFTGGLKDTVKEFDFNTATGNGFGFFDYDSLELTRAVERALDTYHSSDWITVVKNAMKTDCSWENSAGEYIKLYKRIIQSERRPVDA